MANKVTGTTDTTGALTIAQSMAKSVLVVGKKTGTPTTTTADNTIFTIRGTADAEARFGTGSTVVKAVKALIQNGVDTIYGIIVTAGTGVETDPDNYAAALEASLGEKSIKCIVMDNQTDTVIAELKTHLAMAEREDLFRYAVLAAESDDNDEIVEMADGINDSRIFLIAPTFVSGTTKVDPMVVSAGITGVIMTETDDPALPMNGVVVNGIGNVNKAILESDKAQFEANGVTVLYNDGSPTIHRLVTTYTTDAIWQEGTTRFIADYVLENIENTLRANYMFR